MGSCDTIRIWKDLWNGSILQHSFPQLFSFTKDENISILSVREHDYLDELFNIPLLEEAFEQFCKLQILMQSLVFNNNPDTWTYI
jgi:predicted PP-loop superfamily ATPase